MISIDKAYIDKRLRAVDGSRRQSAVVVACTDLRIDLTSKLRVAVRRGQLFALYQVPGYLLLWSRSARCKC